MQGRGGLLKPLSNGPVPPLPPIQPSMRTRPALPPIQPRRIGLEVGSHNYSCLLTMYGISIILRKNLQLYKDLVHVHGKLPPNYEVMNNESLFGYKLNENLFYGGRDERTEKLKELVRVYHGIHDIPDMRASDSYPERPERPAAQLIQKYIVFLNEVSKEYVNTLFHVCVFDKTDDLYITIPGLGEFNNGVSVISCLNRKDEIARNYYRSILETLREHAMDRGVLQVGFSLLGFSMGSLFVGKVARLFEENEPEGQPGRLDKVYMINPLLTNADQIPRTTKTLIGKLSNQENVSKIASTCALRRASGNVDVLKVRISDESLRLCKRYLHAGLDRLHENERKAQKSRGRVSDFLSTAREALEKRTATNPLIGRGHNCFHYAAIDEIDRAVALRGGGGGEIGGRDQGEDCELELYDESEILAEILNDTRGVGGGGESRGAVSLVPAVSLVAFATFASVLWF